MCQLQWPNPKFKMVNHKEDQPEKLNRVAHDKC